VEKEKIVEVVKYVDNGGKSTRLSIANEWVYGINRELNPTLGLEIYHEEADKANNPAACNILGQVYELGSLLPKDESRALSYYRKSMDMKDSRGTYLYAKSLEKGLLKNYKPDKEDLAQALKLLNQAAEMNVELK
jgi:TPR repeat protein